MRILVGLSHITADPHYRRIAVSNYQYYFAHHQADNGLLAWSGHQFVGLRMKISQHERSLNGHDLWRCGSFRLGSN